MRSWIFLGGCVCLLVGRSVHPPFTSRNNALIVEDRTLVTVNKEMKISVFRHTCCRGERPLTIDKSWQPSSRISLFAFRIWFANCCTSCNAVIPSMILYWVDALTVFAYSSVNPSGEITGKRQSIYLDRFVISMIAVGLLWAKRPAHSPSPLSNMNRSGIYR